jgi:hypothetical protein
VNKVVLYLREQAYLMDHAEGGFHVHDPLGLLTAWKKARRFERTVRREFFTLKQGRALHESLAQFNCASGHVAYAVFSAADFQAPNVRHPKTWLYVSVDCEEKLLQEMEAKEVDSGGNLVILTPEDGGVFQLAEQSKGRLPCTNPVQTYLDLYGAGGRGEEAAEALLNQKLLPAWNTDAKP